MAAALSPLASEVRRHDRDRFVTVLFAPAERREALFALYAFNSEIARIRESVTEPLLGEMRLQWWRDALATIYGGGDLAHPVARGLAEAIRARDLSRENLERLIDARAADLVNGPPDTLATLEAYAQGTAATLVTAALEALGARGEAARAIARDAGIGWALVGLLRAIPFHASSNRLFLPADLLAAQGLSPEDALTPPSEKSSLPRKRESNGQMDSGFRGNDEGMQRVARSLAERAHQHLAGARTMRSTVPRTARAALLIVPLAETYLARLARANHNLWDRNWSVTRPSVAKLALRSLTRGF